MATRQSAGLCVSGGNDLVKVLTDLNMTGLLLFYT